MNINEIFAQVNKNTSEYDLGTSDFAVTIDSVRTNYSYSPSEAT